MAVEKYIKGGVFNYVMGFDNLSVKFDAGMDALKSGISGNPITATAIGLGAGALVGGVVGSVVSRSKKRRAKKSKSKSTRKKSSSSRSRKRRGYRKTPRTAGKGKDRSSKRIRYTKRGQPYIIQSNGRARFLKKSSARSSHKRKGGRY